MNHDEETKFSSESKVTGNQRLYNQYCTKIKKNKKVKQNRNGSPEFDSKMLNLYTRMDQIADKSLKTDLSNRNYITHLVPFNNQIEQLESIKNICSQIEIKQICNDVDVKKLNEEIETKQVNASLISNKSTENSVCILFENKTAAVDNAKKYPPRDSLKNVLNGVDNYSKSCHSPFNLSPKPNEYIVYRVNISKDKNETKVSESELNSSRHVHSNLVTSNDNTSKSGENKKQRMPMGCHKANPDQVSCQYCNEKRTLIEGKNPKCHCTENDCIETCKKCENILKENAGITDVRKDQQNNKTEVLDKQTSNGKLKCNCGTSLTMMCPMCIKKLSSKYSKSSGCQCDTIEKLTKLGIDIDESLISKISCMCETILEKYGCAKRESAKVEEIFRRKVSVSEKTLGNTTDSNTKPIVTIEKNTNQEVNSSTNKDKDLELGNNILVHNVQDITPKEISIISKTTLNDTGDSGIEKIDDTIDNSTMSDHNYDSVNDETLENEISILNNENPSKIQMESQDDCKTCKCHFISDLQHKLNQYEVENKKTCTCERLLEEISLLRKPCIDRTVQTKIADSNIDVGGKIKDKVKAIEEDTRRISDRLTQTTKKSKVPNSRSAQNFQDIWAAGELKSRIAQENKYGSAMPVCKCPVCRCNPCSDRKKNISRMKHILMSGVRQQLPRPSIEDTSKLKSSFETSKCVNIDPRHLFKCKKNNKLLCRLINLHGVPQERLEDLWETPTKIPQNNRNIRRFLVLKPK